MKDYRLNHEKQVAKKVQENDGVSSVEDISEVAGGVSKVDPSAGIYYGCPTPMDEGYKGAEMKDELDSLQKWTKGGK